ncbi:MULTISPECIES: hypothetical protein [Nostoc]|uniref:Uncharacterized protein n=1 Tax=Nostoc paludosum FACHB-159 TaxID=2692908 RepID=A0ABR8KJI0_9NOSO|nr:MULTISPECIES: hypothetical protein [Nostoc]MBD2682638.1 hypothetical protein [Nostoc sp. FACHB-857]MBD2738971.1 hypothetical protein [Nostoc paludosum FACHB-159]
MNNTAEILISVVGVQPVVRVLWSLHINAVLGQAKGNWLVMSLARII